MNAEINPKNEKINRYLILLSNLIRFIQNLLISLFLFF